MRASGFIPEEGSGGDKPRRSLEVQTVSPAAYRKIVTNFPVTMFERYQDHDSAIRLDARRGNQSSMKQRITLIVIVAAAALHTVLPAARADSPPNIVFILADDLGWADIACFGSDLYQTPHIDRLADDGVKFTASYAACHVCSPTRASIMTGKYPARLRLTDYIPGGRDRGLRSPEWTKFLPLEEVTVAEALGDAGYVSGHFGKWHLSRDKEYRRGRPLDPGSQGFHDVLTTLKPGRNDDPEADPHHVDQITDAALAFIEANRAGPFFCYVTHNSVHRPVLGQAELVSKYEALVTPDHKQKSAIYAAMVEDLDASVGRILARLDELGIAEETLVVFTSDNGGFLGDEKDGGTSNFPLRAGKGTNYEGGVRVPTIVRWPGVTPRGAICDVPIISCDFYPTLLAIAGTEGDESHNSEVDGINLLPLLKDPAAQLDRESIFWHYPHYHAQGATPHGAVRAGDWKLIEFYEDSHVELYNLQDDPGETRDKAAAEPERVRALSLMLDTWRSSIDAQMPERK